MEVKKDEDWMQKRWRPAMGWMYMLICVLDMAIFPVLWSLLQVFTKQPITQWAPLTLQGAGLFHLAMGAVLGIAAWGRTQEKVAGTASNYTPTMQSPVPVNYSTPYSGSVTNTSYQSQSFESPPQDTYPNFTPSTQQVAAAGPLPGYGATTAAPGGRRPVTPNFNV
jgi:hypothetical protein